jgi:hypothetical protein
MIFPVHQWQKEALDLAAMIRLGHNVEAGLILVNCVEQLVTAYPQFPAKQQRDFQSILSAMLACQERQDWIGLADYLEYELQQLLIELNDTIKFIFVENENKLPSEQKTTSLCTPSAGLPSLNFVQSAPFSTGL